MGCATSTSRLGSYEPNENALRVLPNKQDLFLLANMMDDILLKSAMEWNQLCDTHFRITYGLKGKLHVIDIGFAPEDYYHLAGFHYAQGVMSNFRGHGRALRLVLDGKITIDRLKMSEHYEDRIEPRLLALCHLGESLRSQFCLLSFDRSRYPFATDIKADYLIASDLDGVYYTFLVGSSNNEYGYKCCSIFRQDSRDYTTRQTKLAVLKTEKLDVNNGQWTVLYVSNHLREDV